MPPAPSNFIMGMNVSNEFQSKPIDPNAAMAQLAPLVGLVKTFSLSQRNQALLHAATLRNLTLAVGTSNDEIENFAAGNTANFIAQIKPYWEKIAWVCVGNEPLGSWYNNQYNSTLVKAVDNIAAALPKEWQIGVTVPQNFEFMGSSYPPSAGVIKPNLVDIIKGTCAAMKRTGAPFMVNIYPFLTRIMNSKDVPLDYCLFTATSDHWVTDGAFTYKNIFDAMIDALHMALTKIGFGDLQIIIGECGWPTAGHEEATSKNAQIFLQNLINHCRSGAGTPRLPGKKIPCFVFEAYDEDQKSVKPGQFERHWGVFESDGREKFPLNWHP